MNLKELKAEWRRLYGEVKKLADALNARGKDAQFTGEERSAWDRANSEIDTVKAKIELAEKIEERDAEMRRDSGGDAGRENSTRETAEKSQERSALALQAWARARSGRECRDDHIEAARECGIRLGAEEIALPVGLDYRRARVEYGPGAIERRALSAILGSAGGYLVPEGFVPRIESALLAWGNVRQVSDVMRTANGNPLPWPTNNDTGNEGVEVAENAAVGEQDLVFGTVTFGAYKYTSRIIRVPAELLEDNAVNLVALLGDKIGERLSRITNRRFTTGDGAAKPFGVVNASTLGVTAASPTALAADELIDLLHSVDPAYRMMGPSVGFMLHDTVLRNIRKLKDGNGQYLWGPGLNGEPGRLLGYPVHVNNHMASTLASGTRSVLFGDFSRYKVREVNEIRLKRLVERYADSDQEAFLGFMRCDGALIDAGTGPVKHIVH